MTYERNDSNSKGALGSPSAPSGERGVPQRAGDLTDVLSDENPAAEARRLEHEILNDPSRIANGYRQLNAAAFSGNRTDPRTQSQQSEEKKRNAEEAFSREMQRLAEWNTKMVTIAGVQMTNEDAQRARRRFSENEDEYTERAVRRGLIRDGEQSEFKRTMRRRYELEDRTGRGIDSVEDRKELADLKKSKMGRAADTATADIHTGQGIAANVDAKASLEAKPAAREDALPTAREIFQSTPVAQAAFSQAAQPAPMNAAPVAPPPAPAHVSREVKATGLEI